MKEESPNEEMSAKKGTFIKKFERFFGLSLNDLKSWDRFVKLMYRPTDPSSLGITRLLFGFFMISDIPEERGGSGIDFKWGSSRECRFPLFNFLVPLPLPYMGLLYGIMWMGALGITLGYKFRVSLFAFTIPYWYLYLLDITVWNNHSYLFGIVAVLLLGSSANHYCSVDGILNPSLRDKHVPLWNYFILKYQFFMLYFLAGLKKSDVEWLEGYSMMTLGRHWVFDPFKIFLTTEQIDFLIVHWFGFIFDLTIGFWLLYDLTRPYAMIFCALFHVMNSRLFAIGMFPYVCLATMPLFCNVNWPRKLTAFLFRRNISEPGTSDSCIYESIENTNVAQQDGNRQNRKELPTQINWKHKLVTCLLLTHCGIQLFLPYSHFVTKGHNNWVQGLYGYSWDMMIHTWNTELTVVKVIDNKTGRASYLDPKAWTKNRRWHHHAEMCVKYAQCLKENLLIDLEEEKQNARKLSQSDEEVEYYISSDDISIYIDVWCSLNKRFQQRMFNPNYDLLKANWSLFTNVEWLMPVLTEYNDLRPKILDLRQYVNSWSDYSEVLFVADFPGLYLETFITRDLVNVTLTVLEGEGYYTTDDKNYDISMTLRKGASVRIPDGVAHRVKTLGSKPACYMYTYINGTWEEEMKQMNPLYDWNSKSRRWDGTPFPILEDMETSLERIESMLRFIWNSILNVVYDVPMINRFSDVLK